MQLCPLNISQLCRVRVLFFYLFRDTVMEYNVDAGGGGDGEFYSHEILQFGTSWEHGLRFSFGTHGKVHGKRIEVDRLFRGNLRRQDRRDAKSLFLSVYRRASTLCKAIMKRKAGKRVGGGGEPSH